MTFSVFLSNMARMFWLPGTFLNKKVGHIFWLVLIFSYRKQFLSFAWKIVVIYNFKCFQKSGFLLKFEKLAKCDGNQIWGIIRPWEIIELVNENHGLELRCSEGLQCFPD